jgi:UDP-N-acetylmuramoyl-tripeptide--D-alanyl-D-alanine ligase
MRISEAARVLEARFIGADVEFTGVATDSRTIRRGDLFVALRGERYDGHEYVAQAASAGAAAALVENTVDQGMFPQIVRSDTRRALGMLAKCWRQRFSPALIAIAGSNGKTTTKEMLAAILRTHAGEDAVLATAGNLNNDIGLPLTLLRLRASHRYCAIEIGMNHKGEISALADITCPTIAVVTNAQREHLEFMGSVDEVAAENAAVYAALPESGIAVVNADDTYAPVFRHAAAGHSIVDFGLTGAVTMAGGYALKGLASEIRLRTPAGEVHTTLDIPGLHNVRNALAAAACAHAAGVGLNAIGAGLAAFRPYTGRLQIKHATSGATVIDDTYNANPDSVRAAIDVLAACARPTVLVLGDMGEVGEHEAAFHREIGAYARSRTISTLLALGNATRATVGAFGEAGTHAESLDELLKSALAVAGAGSTLLVKGSRFMRMERVVAALCGEETGDH